jgi:hypothetical protein
MCSYVRSSCCCCVSCLRRVCRCVAIVEYNVIITFLHTHTEKKKKKLRMLLPVVHRRSRYQMGMLHVVSERVQPATWDCYGFR